MTREYIATRKKIAVRQGETYENVGGGVFRAKSSGNNAVMQNVKSGWCFYANGIGMYEDGRIDWDYSTNGAFASL